MRLLSAAATALLALASASVGGVAHAADPIVAGSCATTVQGAPGTPVSLSPAAVTQPITDLVRAVPLLGPPLAEPFRQAFAQVKPMPIGAVQVGTTTISGGTIANAVMAEVNKIPLLGPILGTLDKTVRTTLTQGCQVTVVGVNKVVAPVQDGAKAVADASQQAVGAIPGAPKPPGQQPQPQPGTNPGTQPGTQPGVPGVGAGAPSNRDFSLYPIGSNFGRVPLFSYGSLPFAMPGLYSPSPGVRYGSQVPRASSGTGVEGDSVQAAGRATALPRLSGPGGVGAPVLVAVLMLALVTGALVRTWALRRTPA
ncbi:hypothetical protein SAMN04488074_106114 [Lentzea albidocapillata subsp. violacea]|uniref:Uncharacterized protein n=1 Tax=Lentzea albidocapillata subsp. violacea TaxID=128104 RepID=A0A1G9D1J3_9PSEU|nr:hypothetical protein [Lentzea albidocapillata]SDK57806.1 hypothetical protein SAMN04488074_106114 [Lentzea albidocapillata subsp. violacea]